MAILARRLFQVAVSVKCERISALIASLASVQNCDSAVALIDAAAESFSVIQSILADRAYVSHFIQEPACAASIALHVIKRDEQVKGFAPVRRHWMGE